MTARMGADDLHELASVVPDLLRRVTGLEPAPHGRFVELDEHGFESTKRLAAADAGGTIIVAMWPGELKSQAEHLYTRGRAEAMIGAARDRGWHVEPSPHLAFFNSSAQQRLYMSPDLDPVTYARRWKREDRQMFGRHPREALEPEIRPWLIARGYLQQSEGDVFEAFVRVLGRRKVDVRAAFRFKHRFERQADLQARARSIRADINAIFGAAGEPLLPAAG